MSCIADGLSLPLATLAYLTFGALAIVGPAVAVFRLLRVPVDTAVVVPLGLALCAGAYWLSLVSGWPWLFVATIVSLDLALLGAWRRPWRFAGGPSPRGALAPVIALVALFAVTQYPLNRCDSGGGFAFDTLERVDTAFHVGVTWELANGWPPQVPGLAGITLDYHFGPHLVRAAALRWAGVHPYDAMARFDLTLWALALVLALRSAAWAAGAPAAVVRWVPWTVLLTDMSWLAAPWARGAWLTELLGSNLLLSLFFTNAVVPALAMTFAALACLARAENDPRTGAEPDAGRTGWRWLVIGAMLAAAVPFFKVFLAAQLLFGLGVAFLLGRSRRGVAALGAPCLLGLLLLATGGGARTVRVLVAPLSSVRTAVDAVGLGPAHGAGLVMWGGLWLLASLGLRLVGLPRALQALRGGAPAVVLAVIALSGWPLRLLFRVSADGQFDEAVYFTVQSGALLWLFAVWGVVGIAERTRRPVTIGVSAVLLALPTTAEFVWRKATTAPERIPPAVMRATSWLARETRPGEVVLQPSASRYPPPPVVFIGRRVPYAEYLPYLTQFAPEALLAERLRDVRRFFKDKDAGLAERWHARFVCAFGHETAVEDSPRLELAFEDDPVRIYRIRQP